MEDGTTIVANKVLTGARVVIVGGRQSAYEWAALLCDHGAARVDVVHRHDTAEEQQVVALRFWQVGRLTLEHWLVPSLAGVLDQVSLSNGFPDLSEGFETSLDGLYVTGFASTRDFGPFYGFTKGCPSSARIAEMMR